MTKRLLRTISRRLPPPVREPLLSVYRRGRRTARAAAGSRAGVAVAATVRRARYPFRGATIDRLVNAAEPIVLSASTQHFRVEVEPYRRYLLSLTTASDHAADSHAGIVSYHCLDWRGRTIRSGAINKPESPAVGYFDYLPRVPRDRRSDYVVFTPGGSRYIDIGLRTWKGSTADDPPTIVAADWKELGKRTAAKSYDLPSRPLKRTPLRLAVVADTFTVSALSQECAVVEVKAKGYAEQLREFCPDLLLVESAWNGSDGDWQYCLYRLKPTDRRLPDLVEAARRQGIPTLFWNKEDPAHYDDFIDAARLFDHVATTDAALLDRYRSDLGHDGVFALPFCIQHDIHNPRHVEDQRAERIAAAAFMGSWWAEKFDERRTSQEELFKGAAPHGLEIFDRYLMFHEHERYRMAPEWLPYVHGTLAYRQALSAYRMYDVMLNVNTVTDSPTMFSRRALEASACGAAVVSNPSEGTAAAFGDIVIEAATAGECSGALEALATDRGSLHRRGHRGYRLVHEQHTWTNRMRDVASACRLVLPDHRDPKIAVVLATKRPDGAQRVIDWLGSLDGGPFTLELAVVTAFDPDELTVDEKRFERVALMREPAHHTLGDSLNVGFGWADADFVAKVDDDDLYGPNYFRDLLLAAEYSRADIVGKQCHMQYFESVDRTVIRYPGSDHRFTDFVCGSTLLCRSHVVDAVRFPSRRVGEDSEYLRRAGGAGLRVFSADRFNYISMRRADLDSHTWQEEDHQLLNGNETAPLCTGIATQDLEV